MANVLLLNGSPHAHGAIDLALTEVAQTLQECGLTTEIVHIGQQDEIVLIDAADDGAHGGRGCEAPVWVEDGLMVADDRTLDVK